ncbi:IS30 family transposase, partial [Furfurilactobacillus entadae]|uniref:IS30 family transposase n=1 Tax=Furfurilactobacillus entadae TaxID=2922307 RepID=UPI0038B39B71
FYFPDAHAPWERGTNENTNGLVREYFPKKADLNNYSAQEIKHIVNKINQRPRKCLNWQTPDEVYHQRVLHLV